MKWALANWSLLAIKIHPNCNFPFLCTDLLRSWFWVFLIKVLMHNSNHYSWQFRKSLWYTCEARGQKLMQLGHCIAKRYEPCFNYRPLCSTTSKLSPHLSLFKSHWLKIKALKDKNSTLQRFVLIAVATDAATLAFIRVINL